MENEVHVEKTGQWKSFLSSGSFSHYRYNIPAIIGSTLILIAILTAVMGRFLAPQNPYDLTQINLFDSYLSSFQLDGGKISFLLGTDEQGRDILSAIIYGSASSIIIGLVGMAASCCTDTTLGLIAGYPSGKTDATIMRIADIQLSLPSMLIAPSIMPIFGRGMGKLLTAPTVVGWVTYARTVRGRTPSVKKTEYVKAAKTISLPGHIIIIKHVLPNVASSVIVLATIQIGSFILTEATLSFLGIGVPITQLSLGLLAKTGLNMLFPGLWQVSISPDLYTMLIVLGINLLGDFLRNELNPSLKQTRWLQWKIRYYWI